jgi:hypothetical protein
MTMDCLEPNAFPASELANDNPFVKEVLRTRKEIKIDKQKKVKHDHQH